jgi:hypothetical protein
MLVQLDRLVKEFIVPLEKQINSEHEENKQVAESEAQEIVGQKRRSRTSSASKEMVAAGGTRRSKRVKVAPTRYVPVVEEVSLEAFSRASSGVVIRNTALPASPASPPLDNISTTTETTVMNGINEDVNTGGSSRRVLAVAAATRAKKRKKGNMSFDERFKDLTAFKAEFGHCNVPQTQSRNNKHSSLGNWCNNIRRSYKAIKEGRRPGYKLSKADIRRLENAGFEWVLRCKTYTFDERFKDLMAFKAEHGHCNVPRTKSRNNKHSSLGKWCSNIRQAYKPIKEGGNPGRKLSKADIRRLENAGFEWGFGGKTYTFDERFKDLMAFKANVGHCNVPTTKSSNKKHSSLGQWCNDIRRSYKAIQRGRGMLRCNISKDHIRRLEKAGFDWRLT